MHHASLPLRIVGQLHDHVPLPTLLFRLLLLLPLLLLLSRAAWAACLGCLGCLAWAAWAGLPGLPVATVFNLIVINYMYFITMNFAMHVFYCAVFFYM